MIGWWFDCLCLDDLAGKGRLSVSQILLLHGGVINLAHEIISLIEKEDDQLKFAKHMKLSMFFNLSFW